MKYYVMTVNDRLGRKFEQVFVADDEEQAKRELQRLCGARFVVGEASEYFGGAYPNTTPYQAKENWNE